MNDKKTIKLLEDEKEKVRKDCEIFELSANVNDFARELLLNGMGVLSGLDKAIKIICNTSQKK